MNLNTIGKKQETWVKSVGWGKERVLESLAMIASEVGEAVNECRGEKPTNKFGTELADIILRVACLAHRNGIDLDLAIHNKMRLNSHRGTRGRKV